MKKQIDSALAKALTRWVDWVDSRPRTVAIAILALTVVLGIYTALNLGINSDNLSLIPANLPSRQAHEKFIQHFPNLEEAIFVVIDARTPELAREAATMLSDQLQGQPDAITEAYLPGGGDFFERNGLLYRSPEELDDFADEMARIQPLIGELEADLSLAHMATILRDGLDERDPADDDADQWVGVLDRVSEATLAAWDKYPVPVSWESVLLQGSSLDLSTRRVVVVHPVLDYHHVLQGRIPIERIRAAAEVLQLTPEHGVTVRVTGNPALNYDEMMGFAWDIGGGGVICFFVVSFVLLRAMRSLKLVVAALATLIVGLVWTGAFTAATVGYLNPLTLSFAILFIGLGVDFGIHLGTGYADGMRRGRPHAEALREAAAHVGTALVFCTITTAIGFYVFVPTDYRGVSQLGLIAGSSMFVIFFLTLTFFPALLGSWLRIDPERDLGKDVRFRTGWWQGFDAHPAAIRWSALALFGMAAAIAPGIRFDSNVVEMRDPGTESVRAFKDLLDEPRTSPWYLNVLLSDVARAGPLAAKLEALDEVDYTVSLASFVPEDQDDKLEILDDVAYLFEKPPGLAAAEAPVPQEQINALRELERYLAGPSVQPGDADLAAAMARLSEHLADFLARVGREGQPEEALTKLDAVLLTPLPAQLARLRRALSTDGITLEDLPPSLVRRMLAPSGVARLQVYPSQDLDTIDELEGFVTSVQAVAPNIAGVPLNLVEFGQVTKSSFSQALISAVLVISILIWMLWRSLADVALIMTPLILAATCTAAVAVLLELPFDFTNVVVIPLLLGIGVDSAIHLVARANAGLEAGENLRATATARAVYYSALTTAVSFGSLSLASHNGISGLGQLLAVGLLLNVLCILILLPALLAWRRPVTHAPGHGA
jgi:hopanoid biosynthesis associated RND transporter like protein HpnN